MDYFYFCRKIKNGVEKIRNDYWSSGSLAYYGFDDYLLLEQSDSIGGFWKSSTYDSVRMHDFSRLYKTPEDLLDKYNDRFLTKFDVPIYLEEYAKYYQISIESDTNYS